MVERANGRMTVPQIFIGATHVGGCDDLYALERAGKLDALLAAMSQARAPHDTASPRSRVGLVQMRSGLTPQANMDAAVQADRGGQDMAAPTTC